MKRRRKIKTGRRTSNVRWRKKIGRREENTINGR